MSHHHTHTISLEDTGLKKTKHRQLLLQLLQSDDCLVSAEDLYLEALKHDQSISLSTVYRTLETFMEHDIVGTVQLEQENKLLYELAHHSHLHHLICTECHKVIHIEECPVKSLQETIGSKYDFQIQHHNLEFYGICDDCQRKNHSAE
jgi:Fur family ferric uptake transcriptional regulator